MWADFDGIFSFNAYYFFVCFVSELFTAKLFGKDDFDKIPSDIHHATGAEGEEIQDRLNGVETFNHDPLRVSF